ncbi:MAG: methyltransferase domain-containing protein [Thermomicrobiales bacterium]
MRTHQLYGERKVDLDQICYEALALGGDEAVLDAGCGPGQFLEVIRGKGHRGKLVGLDQSAAMVADVRQLGFDAVEGDVQALPFASGSFDRVVARHMLYHVPDIGLALREFSRVLEPDGCLLMTTNSNGSMPGILGLLQDLLAAFDQPEWDRPDARFCIENAEGFFEEAGYTVGAGDRGTLWSFTHRTRSSITCVSTLPSLDVNVSLHAEMESWLVDEAGRRFEAIGREWRDPTYAGVYVGKSL